MKTLKHYKVEISDRTGIIKDRNTFAMTTHNILGENEKCLVIDDASFTTIRLAKDKYQTCLNQPAIRITTGDSCFGNSIWYDLYTFEAKRAATIKKDIEREITKRFGFFVNGLDLSIIDERKLK